MTITTSLPSDRISLEHPADSISAEKFKSAFSMHPSGVAVITADAGDRPAAMTISSLSSVSAEPPLVMFSLSTLSGPTPTFLAADSVVIHLLGSDQIELAKLGATPGVDRFAGSSQWTRLPTGEPVFPDTHAWLRGRIVHRLCAGTSVICVAHIVDAMVSDDASTGSSNPLVYHSRTWHELGPNSSL
ncbi:MAG: flavin reductase family protein [Terrimesophilobacter sp.]